VALTSENAGSVSSRYVEPISSPSVNEREGDGRGREAGVLKHPSNESLTGAVQERTDTYAGHNEGSVYISLDTTTTSASEVHGLQGQEGFIP